MLDRETALTLVMDGEVFTTTWGSFIQDNDLDEEPEWKASIEALLLRYRVYHGGGGAQPSYHLVRTEGVGRATDE